MVKNNGNVVASLVFSIVSIILFCFSILIQSAELGMCISSVGLGLAIAAIVCGVKGKKNKNNKGMAIAGFVIGIVGTCFCFFSLFGSALILKEGRIYDKNEDIYNINYDEDDYDEQANEESNNSSLTMGQKNAINKAKAYLNYTAFSRTGLIEQLEFEKYSNEDAVFAVDSLNVDWKEQAVSKAKSYLNYTAFSKEGLIEQLEFEGFTHEEAVYGVEKNGY